MNVLVYSFADSIITKEHESLFTKGTTESGCRMIVETLSILCYESINAVSLMHMFQRKMFEIFILTMNEIITKKYLVSIFQELCMLLNSSYIVAMLINPNVLPSLKIFFDFLHEFPLNNKLPNSFYQLILSLCQNNNTNFRSTMLPWFQRHLIPFIDHELRFADYAQDYYDIYSLLIEFIDDVDITSTMHGFSHEELVLRMILDLKRFENNGFDFKMPIIQSLRLINKVSPEHQRLTSCQLAETLVNQVEQCDGRTEILEVVWCEMSTHLYTQVSGLQEALWKFGIVKLLTRDLRKYYQNEKILTAILSLLMEFDTSKVGESIQELPSLPSGLKEMFAIVIEYYKERSSHSVVGNIYLAITRLNQIDHQLETYMDYQNFWELSVSILVESAKNGHHLMFDRVTTALYTVAKYCPDTVSFDRIEFASIALDILNSNDCGWGSVIAVVNAMVVFRLTDLSNDLIDALIAKWQFFSNNVLMVFKRIASYFLVQNGNPRQIADCLISQPSVWHLLKAVLADSVYDVNSKELTLGLLMMMLQKSSMEYILQHHEALVTWFMDCVLELLENRPPLWAFNKWAMMTIRTIKIMICPRDDKCPEWPLNASIKGRLIDGFMPILKDCFKECSLSVQLDAVLLIRKVLEITTGKDHANAQFAAVFASSLPLLESALNESNENMIIFNLNCCEILNILLKQPDKTQLMKESMLKNDNVIQVLVSLLRHGKMNARVVEVVCVLLNDLALNEQEGVMLTGINGGCDLLVHSMRYHIYVPSVILSVCEIVDRMCKDSPDNRLKFVKVSNCFDVFLNLIQHYQAKQETNVVDQAIHCITTLVKDSVEGAKRLFLAGCGSKNNVTFCTTFRDVLQAMDTGSQSNLVGGLVNIVLDMLPQVANKIVKNEAKNFFNVNMDLLMVVMSVPAIQDPFVIAICEVVLTALRKVELLKQIVDNVSQQGQSVLCQLLDNPHVSEQAISKLKEIQEHLNKYQHTTTATKKSDVNSVINLLENAGNSIEKGNMLDIVKHLSVFEQIGDLKSLSNHESIDYASANNKLVKVMAQFLSMPVMGELYAQHPQSIFVLLNFLLYPPNSYETIPTFVPMLMTTINMSAKNNEVGQGILSRECDQLMLAVLDKYQDSNAIVICMLYIHWYRYDRTKRLDYDIVDLPQGLIR